MHPKVPLVTLLRLVHLGVALFSPILRRSAMMLASTIVLKTESLGLQIAVDLLEQTRAQLMLFQQVAEVQNRPSGSGPDSLSPTITDSTS